jgi:hypothetical protein
MGFILTLKMLKIKRVILTLTMLKSKRYILTLMLKLSEMIWFCLVFCFVFEEGSHYVAQLSSNSLSSECWDLQVCDL